MARQAPAREPGHRPRWRSPRGREGPTSCPAECAGGRECEARQRESLERGSRQRESQKRGSRRRRWRERGWQQRGSQQRRSQRRRSQRRGSQQRRSQRRGSQQRRSQRRGSQQCGSQPRRWQERGSQQRGAGRVAAAPAAAARGGAGRRFRPHPGWSRAPLKPRLKRRSPVPEAGLTSPGASTDGVVGPSARLLPPPSPLRRRHQRQGGPLRGARGRRPRALVCRWIGARGA